MKRLFSAVFAVLFVLFCLAPAALAARDPQPPEEVTETLEDGSYFVVAVGERNQNEAAETHDPVARLIAFFQRLIRLLRKQQTVSKTKYVSYYDANGTLLWTLYLSADFIYNGKTAACDSVAVSFDILDADWRNLASAGSVNGDTAVGQFAMRQYKLGVPLKTVQKTLTLTCRPDGAVF